jgi:hypothetical protein
MPYFQDSNLRGVNWQLFAGAATSFLIWDFRS